MTPNSLIEYAEKVSDLKIELARLCTKLSERALFCMPSVYAQIKGFVTKFNKHAKTALKSDAGGDTSGLQAVLEEMSRMIAHSRGNKVLSPRRMQTIRACEEALWTIHELVVKDEMCPFPNKEKLDEFLLRPQVNAVRFKYPVDTAAVVHQYRQLFQLRLGKIHYKTGRDRFATIDKLEYTILTCYTGAGKGWKRLEKKNDWGEQGSWGQGWSGCVISTT